jgi:hypothetical protein
MAEPESVNCGPDGHREPSAFPWIVGGPTSEDLRRQSVSLTMGLRTGNVLNVEVIMKARQTN